LKDVFIEELLNITKKYIWKIQYTTFRRLKRIESRYKSVGNTNNFKGDLGEEYIIREYLYPSLHNLNCKYDVRRNYTGNRKGNGDTDVRIKINDKTYLGTYLGEIKNWNENYDIEDDYFKKLILKPLQTADKHHKHNWILFIHKKHLKSVRKLCRIHNITVIPIYLFLDKQMLKRIEYLFDRTYNSIKNCNESRWDMNLVLGTFRPSNRKTCNFSYKENREKS